MIRAVSTTMSYSPLSIIRNDDGVLGCATYSATRKKSIFRSIFDLEYDFAPLLSGVHDKNESPQNNNNRYGR